jgi:hypothetical protein
VVERDEIEKAVKLVREGLLITAMGLESAGRAMRIAKEDVKADKGLVMAVQALYSIAYGLEDFSEKLNGVRYRKKR